MVISGKNLEIGRTTPQPPPTTHRLYLQTRCNQSCSTNIFVINSVGKSYFCFNIFKTPWYPNGKG